MESRWSRCICFQADAEYQTQPCSCSPRRHSLILLKDQSAPPLSRGSHDLVLLSRPSAVGARDGHHQRLQLAHSLEQQLPTTQRADVTADDIQRAPGQSVEDYLKGRVAGVDRGSQLRWRNLRSHSRRDARSTEGRAALRGGRRRDHAGAWRSLTGVDPYDIESIKVLKDPADTALYGMRGANGVIVIRTKRGTRRVRPN